MNNIDSITDTEPDPNEGQRKTLSSLLSTLLTYDSADTLRLLKRDDLSMPRFAALNIVAKRGAASISEISTYLELSLGNTSILVDKLVCHGFVTRVEDVNDRRHKLVRLTNKGQDLVQELRDARIHSVVKRMLFLPPELLDRTIAVLEEVVAQLPEPDAVPEPRT